MDPYQMAISLLDKRRQARADLKRQRQLEIYDAIPKIKALDEALATFSLDLAKQALLGGPSVVSELKAHTQSLIEDKQLLLQIGGYAPDYLSPTPHCQHCEDTGFILTQRCNCLKKLVVDNLYERSNLKSVLDKENFEYFDIRYYSEVKDPKTGISPRENIQEIYKESLKFVTNFSVSHTNLLFYGASGLGKTFLCHCIAKDLLDKNIPVVYTTSNTLTKTIEAARFDKDSASISLMDLFYTSPLLIIDDLGTEFSTIVTQSTVFDIINTRLFQRRSTLISTNFHFKELANIYSERTISRLFGEYNHFRFTGEDIRIQKKKKMAGL